MAQLDNYPSPIGLYWTLLGVCAATHLVKGVGRTSVSIGRRVFFFLLKRYLRTKNEGSGYGHVGEDFEDEDGVCCNFSVKVSTEQELFASDIQTPINCGHTAD